MVLLKVIQFIQMPMILSHLLVLFLSMFALYWLSKLFMNTKLRVFFGK